MRALFLQHGPGSRPGHVGAVLERCGYRIDLLPMSDTIHDGTWTGDFPDPLDYDLLVPLGAIWSVNDRSAVGTWIDRELDLLRRADEHGIPVLGICFGGQALSAAHGGRVETAPRPELGWTMVDSVDPELIPPGPWMQWHTDRFTVPPDAVELARNEIGPQAFRLRRNLAVQFHPEIDEDNVAEWFAMAGDDAQAFAEAAGLTVDGVLAATREHQPRATADADRLVRRFLTEVATDGQAGERLP